MPGAAHGPIIRDFSALIPVSAGIRKFVVLIILIYGYGSIPINTIFSGMNIHLPAILGFTRVQGFDTLPYILMVVGGCGIS